MKVNPVYKREARVGARSFRMALILSVFNGILAMVALLNMYSTLEQVRVTAEIQYSSFLDLYLFVAVLEFAMLLIIMPAITAGSISGERERQTLELILTTKMTPADIVIGKLLSALSTMVMLVVSSFPIIAIVFVYGGITVRDIALLFMCYAVTAVFVGSLGLCCSSICKKTTTATVATYGILLLITAGTYMINAMGQYLSQLITYNSLLGTAADSSSGGFLYMLLWNPVVTFLITIFRMTADGSELTDIIRWFGTRQSNFVLEHWLLFGILTQAVTSAALIAGAVAGVGREKKRSTGKLRY